MNAKAAILESRVPPMLLKFVERLGISTVLVLVLMVGFWRYDQLVREERAAFTAQTLELIKEERAHNMEALKQEQMNFLQGLSGIATSVKDSTSAMQKLTATIERELDYHHYRKQ